MKNFVFIIAIVASVMFIFGRRIEPISLSIKQSLAVGKGDYSAPSESAWVEIGQDSSTKASLLLHATDTSLIDSADRVFGTVLLSVADSGIYINVGGDNYRRLAFADELP